MQNSDTKVCPFCAEDIKAAAIVCRYCGSDLQIPDERKIESSATVNKNQGKKKRRGCSVGGLLVAAVVVLPIMYAVVTSSNNNSTGRGVSQISDRSRSTSVQSEVSQIEAATTVTPSATNTPRATSTPTLEPTPTLTVEQYKSIALQHEVRELTRNVEDYTGDTVLYVGDVLQVIETDVFLSSDVIYRSRFAIDGDRDQVVLLEDRHKEGDDKIRLLDGDKIEVVGSVMGNIEMKTVLGQQVILPHIKIINVEVLE